MKYLYLCPDNRLYLIYIQIYSFRNDFIYGYYMFVLTVSEKTDSRCSLHYNAISFINICIDNFVELEQALEPGTSSPVFV